MIKEFEIQGITVRLRVDGALPIVYRNITGRDLLIDEIKIDKRKANIEEFTFSEIYDIVYVMAQYAGYKGSELDFYGQFAMPVDIYSLYPEVVKMLHEDITTKKD